jgi:hypothetical protein
MKKISIEKFKKVGFFLSGKTKVSSLHEGAKKYGGATYNMETGQLWSNVQGDKYIAINPKRNIVQIFVPTTVHTNLQATDEKIEHMLQVVQSRMKKVKNVDTVVSRAVGSWYSEEKQEVVLESIFLVSQNLDDLNEKDIAEYIEIAEYVKKCMYQEGVSISFNNALCIV